MLKNGVNYEIIVSYHQQDAVEHGIIRDLEHQEQDWLVVRDSDNDHLHASEEDLINSHLVVPLLSFVLHLDHN